MPLQYMLSNSSIRILILTAIVFAVISAFMIPAYFYALRPRRGTTEWMKRLDQPQFAALSAFRLNWSDILWAIVAGAGTVALRLLQNLLAYLGKGQMRLFCQVLSRLAVYEYLPGIILGVGLYLLLRGMNGRVLPAILGAVLGGIVQAENTGAAAFLTLSLMLLWFWTAGPADARMFPRALLFLGSLACYGLVLYYEWALIWLAPVYLAAYLYVLIRRWKYGPRKNRGVTLAVSLLLLLLTGILAAAAVWVFHCLRMDMGTRILDLPFFMELMSQKFILRLRWIVQPFDFFGSVHASDVYLFVLALAALIPVFHGLVKSRDSRCIVLLGLLPFFAAVWFLGGSYFMVPAFILLTGWVWNILTEREHSLQAVGFAAALAVFTLLQQLT